MVDLETSGEQVGIPAGLVKELPEMAALPIVYIPPITAMLPSLVDAAKIAAAASPSNDTAPSNIIEDAAGMPDPLNSVHTVAGYGMVTFTEQTVTRVAPMLVIPEAVHEKT